MKIKLAILILLSSTFSSLHASDLTVSGELTVTSKIKSGTSASNSGAWAIALGRNNTASGDATVAMGSSCVASGLRAFAMGTYASATGDNAVSLGNSNSASGSNSSAFGYTTTAQAQSVFVTGRFNIITGDALNWVATDPLFVIGNGTSTTARSNAVTILKNGNASFTGVVKVMPGGDLSMGTFTAGTPPQ